MSASIRNPFAWAAAAAIALALSAPVHAKMYKYQDAGGNIHVVDDIDKVPLRYRDQVEVRRPSAQPPAPAPAEAAEGGEEGAPAAEGGAAPAGTAPAAPAAGGEAAKEEKKGPTDKQGRDENFWRQRFQNCDQRAQMYKERVEDLGLSGSSDDPGAAERQRKLAEYQKRLTDQQKECKALRDEARKAGAPPAWLR